MYTKEIQKYVGQQAKHRLPNNSKTCFPKIQMFGAMSRQYVSLTIFSMPGRAKIFRAGQCHKSAGPRVRAVPRHPWQRQEQLGHLQQLLVLPPLPL